MFNQNPTFYSMPRWGNSQTFQPFYGFGNSNPLQGLGMIPKKTGLANINWGNLLNNAQRTLNVINQAIPVYNQIKPVWNNAKTMFRLFGEFSKLNASNALANESIITEGVAKAGSVTNGPNFFA